MKFIRHLSLTFFCLLIIINFNSCNNFLSQNTSTVNVELPNNLFEILSSKTTVHRKATDSDDFVLTATMSGSVSQSQTKTITKSNKPLSIVFTRIPLNSIVTVEINILSNDTILYSGKSAETTIISTDATIDLTLSPVIRICTITYDANGASGTIPAVQTGSYGEDLKLAINSGKLAREGYTFAGWNTEQDGTGFEYAEGTNYTLKSDITLYAQWIVTVGTELPNITIGGIKYDKTSEIVIIADGTTVNVHKEDDSNWSTYYAGESNDLKGVFIADRSVTLSPFIMGQYEVTQQLYQAVMNNNPSNFKTSPVEGETQELRPVEQVSWYDAVAFCNELTKKTTNVSDCVYYADDTFTTVYVSGENVYMNPDKKGYRLPTEAEWEFAARGGVQNAEAWNYAYAGVQTAKTKEVFNSDDSDSNLIDFAWYTSNAENKTHEVGLKTGNTLNMFDMSGNVWEWCYDIFDSDVTKNDDDYMESGSVINPRGPASGVYRVMRGDSWENRAYMCSVSYRTNYGASSPSFGVGFRVCRSGE